MSTPEPLPPSEGILVTHFIVVTDQDKSRESTSKTSIVVGGVMLTVCRCIMILVAAVTLVLSFTTSPASAIVGGADDTANRFENVGAIQVRLGSDWSLLCSGTLVSSNIVLAAAHCADNGEAVHPYRLRHTT